MVQDVELLEKLWGTVTEWQQLYNGWKDGRFGDLKVEEMEEAAGRIAKSLQRLGREIKHWPAWTWIKVNPSSCVLPECRNIFVSPMLLHWSNNPALGATLVHQKLCRQCCPSQHHLAACGLYRCLWSHHRSQARSMSSFNILGKLPIPSLASSDHFPSICAGNCGFVQENDAADHGPAQPCHASPALGKPDGGGGRYIRPCWPRLHTGLCGQVTLGSAC